MKLGLLFGYSGRSVSIPLDAIKHAEQLGYDSVWTSEAYGSDAITPAAWILANTKKIRVGTAIMQMPARTPAMAAMTAMTLAQLSGNRFIVGVGASGPQVVEGWHGVPYGKPVTRLKEYIADHAASVRARRGAELRGQGISDPLSRTRQHRARQAAQEHPAHASSRSRSMPRPLTPAGVQAAAQVADGFFPVWMDPEQYKVFQEPIEKGFAAAGGNKTLAQFDIAPFVAANMGDDIKACMAPLKEHMALYIGGMGARGKNFYTDYATRLGFGDAAHKVQDLYLAGNKAEAAAAIPDALVDACHLVGPAARIRDRLQRWIAAGKAGHVGSMLIRTQPAQDHGAAGRGSLVGWVER